MPTASPRCEGWGIALKKIDWRRVRPASVRHLFMVGLVAFVAVVIGLLWLFQIVLLDDFYQLYKSHHLNTTAAAITQNLGNDNLSALAERLAEDEDICILLVDARGETLLSAEGESFCLLHHMNPGDLKWWCDQAENGSGAQMHRLTIQPNRRRYDARDFVGSTPKTAKPTNATLMYTVHVVFPDGTGGTLLLNTMVTPLDATVATLRSQMISITAIVLVLALILAAIVSRLISRPIIETTNAARDLAQGRYVPPKSGQSYQEIDELNATLSRAAAEVGKVEGLQNELIANVSHDLRTPLTMIAGYAEVMRDIPGENTPENMQIVIDETARLSSLVNELLEFSRMQTGHVELSRTAFCLTDSVEEIINRIGKLTAKDGYVIRFVPERRVQTFADPRRVEQVVYNLIGNALTYTGADKTVAVTQEVRGEQVRISIHDSGAGIDAAELPFIWNRYYRTHETHRRAVVGSGLGLNIVRSILEMHGAPFGVDSAPGEGTTFWFELPVAKNE